MKKIKLFGLTVLMVAVLFALAGCSDDGDPDEMSFASDYAKFTIYENYNARFVFDNPSAEMETNFTITQGTVINAKIKDANAAWNESFTGIAYSFDTKNTLIGSQLNGVEFEFSITYTPNEGDPATATINFINGPDSFLYVANSLMGGDYQRQ